MRKSIRLLLFLSLGTVLLWSSKTQFDSLPHPVSNNAVAMVKSGRQFLLFSLMGIGPKKTWDAITSTGYALDTSTGAWTEINPVPGTGRIAAVAVSARDKVFLFGGYVVDAQGNETTVPDVNVLDLKSGRWYRGADIPVPVDDSVAGVFGDRYIYLISGWSKNDTVSSVQMYDVQKDTWTQATPIPGTPVFGHAGALVDGTIVYVDGAHKNPSGDKPKYVAAAECWIGKINPHDPAKIEWTRLPDHPGSARYRIAAGASEKDEKIYFSGGTDNPYNYNGVGYDGRPSEPSAVTFAFNVKLGKWETLNENTPQPTMDHRGLLVTDKGLVILGGMGKGQLVSANMQILPKQASGK
jgi:N-acetylneuraminic acid mutarotase